MTEVRARVRQKGQQFPAQDIEALLSAFHPSHTFLPTTVAVLDAILTDFIIETCHLAALSASYSRRQKIKVDDFKWVLRRDPKKLGRVAEMFAKQRALAESRKAFNFDELGGAAGVVAGAVGAGGGGGAAGQAAGKRGAAAELVGEDGEAAGRGKKGRRGRKKRKVEE